MRPCNDVRTSHERIVELNFKRGAVVPLLKAIRDEFKAVKARKNYLEARLKKIDEELLLLSQGQLLLGDQNERLSG